MNLRKMNLFVLLVSILVLTPTIHIALAQTPSSGWITAGVQQPFSYILWKEGSNYYAKNAYGRLVYSGTNATTVIQNVLDTLGSRGGSLYFQPAEYVIQQIDLNKNYTYIQGTYGTSFKLEDGANSNIFEITASNLVGLVIENIEIDGNKANQADQSSRDALSGILFPDGLNSASDFRIQNVHIHDVRHGASIRINNASNFLLNGIIAKDNGVSGASFACDGVYVGGSTLFHISDSLFLSNTDTGLAIDNSDEFQVTNVEARGNTEQGFSFAKGSSHGLFTNIYGRANKYGFRAFLAGGSEIQNFLAVSNAEFTDNSLYGLSLENTSNVQLGKILYASNGVNRQLISSTLWSNSGTASISSSTTVTFGHNLSGTPTHVECGFKDSGYGSWKWSASSTQITITVEISGTYDFSWYAEFEP